VSSRRDERLFILDTNAYLRLADSFRPLIAKNFGEPPCKLRVVPALDRELKRSPRLSSKFHWASAEEYCLDRRHYLHLKPETREGIDANFDFIRGTAHEFRLPTSPVDMLCLAYALELGATVVTDDTPMIALAFEFEIPILRRIDSLKLLYDEGRASLGEIKNAVDVMEYRDDIPEPRDFWKKYAMYFPPGAEA
jgi:hypothetical protein